jgi:outer membrane receptor protein involved in Fe transport
MKRQLVALLAIAALAAATARAQERGPTAAEAEPEPDKPITIEEEVTVYSATRVAQKVVDAPATMSVITSEALETAPTQNIADMIRAVPGVNVIQNNARDFNLTARQATSTLATSTLVTVDGRSVYLDFFGLVLWDFVPSPSSGEIDQVEVVRGPASVVWGANAVNGVVNFITKPPRANEGFGLVLGAGLFDRDGGSREADGDGYLFNGGFSFADAPNDTWSYKLNAGYYYSEPYSRPVGVVPLDCHPLGVVPCRDASGNAVPGGYPTARAPSRTTAPASPKSTCGWTRTSRPGAASHTRAGTGAPRASFTPASGPSSCKAARTWGTAAWSTTRAPCGSAGS